jgi:hypothetical protein
VTPGACLSAASARTTGTCHPINPQVLLHDMLAHLTHQHRYLPVERHLRLPVWLVGARDPLFTAGGDLRHAKTSLGRHQHLMNW